MSGSNLISPLLDGFVMGPPISSHHGIRCCPAMRHNSDSKYIVKIISVPASQSQLDALLLTGAYKDPGEAMDYFKALADEITAEADLLSRISAGEGFLPMGFVINNGKFTGMVAVTHESVRGRNLCNGVSAGGDCLGDPDLQRITAVNISGVGLPCIGSAGDQEFASCQRVNVFVTPVSSAAAARFSSEASQSALSTAPEIPPAKFLA